MKNLLQQLLSLCLLIGFVSCQSKVNSDGTTHIRGNIAVPHDRVVYYYAYADSIDLFLGIKRKLDSAKVDSKGNFEFSFIINSPQVFSLTCGKSDLLANMVIQPGDQFDVDFIGKDAVPKIVSKGLAAKFNTYLLRFTDQFYREKEAKQDYYIGSNYMDLEHFAMYNARRKAQMLDFYKRYFSDEKLPEWYSTFAESTIEYEIASDRLMYLWKKRMKGEAVIPDSSYLYFTSYEYTNRSSAFVSPSYMRFLDLYIKDIYERMVEQSAIVPMADSMKVPVVGRFLLANKYLLNPERKAVQYNLMWNDGNAVLLDTVSHNRQYPAFSDLQMAFEKKYSQIEK